MNTSENLIIIVDNGLPEIRETTKTPNTKNAYRGFFLFLFPFLSHFFLNRSLHKLVFEPELTRRSNGQTIQKYVDGVTLWIRLPQSYFDHHGNPIDPEIVWVFVEKVVKELED